MTLDTWLYAMLGFAVFLQPAVCGAQEKSREIVLPKSFKELSQKIASKRESIVAYQVHIKETRQVDQGSGLSDIKPESTSEYYFEFSRVEDHVVRAARNVPAYKSNDWVVFGNSEGLYFGGNSSSGILISDEIEPAFKNFFDPLAMGLMFCEIDAMYTPYEDMLLALTQFDVDAAKKKTVGTFSRTDDNTILYEHLGMGAKLTIDPSRDYWPVEFEIRENHPLLAKFKQDKVEKTMWLNIEKVHDVYLPVYCSMSCLSNGNFGRQLKTFTLEWKSVNAVIKTGEEGVDSLCEILKTRKRRSDPE